MVKICKRENNPAHCKKNPVKLLFQIVVLGFLFFLSSCGKQKAVSPQSRFAFGTVCSINLFEAGTDKIYDEIFSLLNSIEEKFSVNIESSEISLINRNAVKNKVEVSEEVYSLLEFSKMMAMVTENNFNPVLGSLIKLWGIGTDRQRVPEKEEIDALKNSCKPENLILENKDSRYFVYLTDEKTQIYLGGIVKGYATDKIVELLKNRGIDRAIIDLGGNIYVFGKKTENPGKEDWRVGIKNPFDQSAEPIKTLCVNSTSIVTSGSYERFFIQDGEVYHHIFDSETGYPVRNGLVSVTIVSEKSVICDALSTACFSGGMELASKLVNLEIFEGIRIIFVSSDGNIIEL